MLHDPHIFATSISFCTITKLTNFSLVAGRRQLMTEQVIWYNKMSTWDRFINFFSVIPRVNELVISSMYWLFRHKHLLDTKRTLKDYILYLTKKWRDLTRPMTTTQMVFFDSLLCSFVILWMKKGVWLFRDIIIIGTMWSMRWANNTRYVVLLPSNGHDLLTSPFFKALFSP